MASEVGSSNPTYLSNPSYLKSLSQTRGPAAPPPIGLVFNTSMARPDAALALAAMYTSSSRNLLRVGGVCVSGAGLGAAIFCDVVGRFYAPVARSSNTVLPVGLAATTPPPLDPPMVKPAIDRKKPNGDPQYVRTIRVLSDTGQAEAVLHNGVTFNVQSAMVLSAPATWLAKSLDLLGSKALYQQRIKQLVIVEAGATGHDASALRKVIAEWPTPIVFCGRDVGDALLFPGAKLDSLFAWAPAHPVVDAYRAFKTMPYDAPLHEVAAIHYAVRPDAGVFQVSDQGTLSVTGDGSVTFAAGGGNVRRLKIDEAKRAETLDALVTMATAAPPPPPARGRIGGD